MRTYARACSLAAAVAAAVAGCGSPTASVSGKVTSKDGKPATGVIAFVPQDGVSYREAVEAPIVDGHYELPTVSVGRKRIEVIVTRDGVGDPSLEVATTPKEVELKPGPQVLDVTLSKMK